MCRQCVFIYYRRKLLRLSKLLLTDGNMMIGWLHFVKLDLSYFKLASSAFKTHIVQAIQTFILYIQRVAFQAVHTSWVPCWKSPFLVIEDAFSSSIKTQSSDFVFSYREPISSGSPSREQGVTLRGYCYTFRTQCVHFASEFSNALLCLQ